ncbi:MAG: hypothetical protein FOGNACKC_03333 [Anaerolineae bacterium]|nr:hypothetical protein [Anaerolineae bacterium]
MNNRVTVTFVILLALTSLASGQLWLRGKVLITGQAALLDIALIILSVVVLSGGLLGLGRILYRIEPLSQESEEKTDG